jgi:hypothetical protein
MNRRFAIRHASPGRTRRLRINGDDLVPGRYHCIEAWYLKVRRSHEDKFQRHAAPPG